LNIVFVICGFLEKGKTTLAKPLMKMKAHFKKELNFENESAFQKRTTF
jgi:G3E family GTPase